MNIEPVTVATSLVSRLARAAPDKHQEDQADADGHIEPADPDIERNLVFPVPRLLEPQHEHRQRLEDEAPDHAEGIGLAQRQHVAPAGDDREDLQSRDQC